MEILVDGRQCSAVKHRLKKPCVLSSWSSNPERYSEQSGTFWNAVSSTTYKVIQHRPKEKCVLFHYCKPFKWLSVKKFSTDLLGAGTCPTGDQTVCTEWCRKKRGSGKGEYLTQKSTEVVGCCWSSIPITWRDHMNITCDHYMSPSGHQLRSCKMCGEALASDVFPDSFGTHNADITWESWNILKCYCRNLHIWHVGIGSQLRRIISWVARLEWDALSVTSWPASFPKIPNHSLWACPTPTHFTQLSVELHGGHGLQVMFPGLNMRPTPSQGRSQWKLIVPPWWCWVLELDPRKRRLGAWWLQGWRCKDPNSPTFVSQRQQ